MGLQVYQRLGIATPFDSQQKLVTSPVLSAYVLGAIRLSLAVYTLFTAIFILVWDGAKLHTASSYFSYFTDLSYIGLCAYFWAAGFQTWMYVRGGRKGYPLQRWPRILQFLHVLLFSTIITYPFLVTIVFWSLLSSPQTFANSFSSWSNISHHAMNSAFALFEIALTRAGPPPWSHIPFLVVILAGYLGIAYITRASQGFYAYSFLDPSKEHGKLAAYILGIGLAECVIFVIARSLCVLRERIVSRCERADTHPPEEIEDWQDIERSETPSGV